MRNFREDRNIRYLLFPLKGGDVVIRTIHISLPTVLLYCMYLPVPYHISAYTAFYHMIRTYTEIHQSTSQLKYIYF